VLLACPEPSLAQAEEAMLDLFCSREVLRMGDTPGTRLWLGSFPYGSRIDIRDAGSMQFPIRKHNGEYIQSCCSGLGPKQCRIATINIKDFDIMRRFDRVLSVEMFEHLTQL